MLPAKKSDRDLFRKKVLFVEGELAKHPQVEIVTRHYFAGGLYVREILIPRGVIATGKIHREESINIMVYGDIVIGTPDGPKRLTGYNVLPGIPGEKKIGYAYEDTLWLTVHANPDSTRDVKALEDRLTAKTFEELCEPEQPAGELEEGEVK